MDRCYNRNCKRYRDYGGRGIKVCDRWKGVYIAFRHDMAPRPEGATLDRIDPDGNYTPANCRWSNSTVQGKNRRNKKGFALLRAWLTPQEMKC